MPQCVKEEQCVGLQEPVHSIADVDLSVYSVCLSLCPSDYFSI